MLLTGLASLASLALAPPTPTRSWLVEPPRQEARLVVTPGGNEISLENGLIRRTFRIAPNGVTIAFDNLMTGTSMLRGVKPEAIVTLDGKRFEIGGLKGQPEYAYLDPKWLAQMTSSPEAFRFVGYHEGTPQARFPWKRTRTSADLPWPPHGVALTLDFRPPESLQAKYRGLTISVHYEMYTGIPALAKWLTVQNGTDHPVNIDHFESEVLAVVEAEASVENWIDTIKPGIHLQSDYAFCGGTIPSSNQTTYWEPDPDFTTQINYQLKAPALLTSKPPIGPDALLKPGERFETFHTFELLFDGDTREQRGLAIRRLQRVVAPWVTENPILMHLRYSDSESIRRAVDQCAAVGFEMIILTFGSGFNMESEDPAYLARVKADVDYAHSKGIQIGGYTLTASRGVDPKDRVLADDVVNPKTGVKGAVFGQSPCLASAWSDGYYHRLLHFIEATGIDVLEDDGSYPGDLCASTEHAHHRGLNDSQWNQWRTITGFYQTLRARGLYINAPDYYFLAGSNKCAMGYRETNWSLPRERQILLGRQNIYDGTWEKAPSMGWMFVPLVEYQGGGAAATLEPLSEHLDAYGWHLAQNFGSGVQACYRGPRLYDTDATKAVVKQWVDFYKRHRAILDSDIVHVRRPDGRGIDCMLHVNPTLPECGLAMVYNPTDQKIDTTLTLPLTYTGLSERARIGEKEGKAREVALDREYNVQIPIKMPPRSITWFVIKDTHATKKEK